MTGSTAQFWQAKARLIILGSCCLELNRPASILFVTTAQDINSEIIQKTFLYAYIKQPSVVQLNWTQ